MPDDPKPSVVDEPKTFVLNNNSSAWPAWASLAVSALVTVTLAYSQFKQVVVPPGPAPIPVVVVEPVKIDVADAIATLNGIRLNAERTKLLVDLVNAGEGKFTLRYQPVGKAELTRVITVEGGDKPLPPVVTPDKPKPDVPVTPPVDPNTKVTSVTYVYEKDSGGIPNHVSTALNKINRESGFTITATIFEDDSTTGGGSVPAQYKAAYEAAKKEGLPVLVVTAGDKVLRSVKAPKTEAEILEAAR